MTPTYLLDTNICIYIAKQKPLHVLKRFKELSVGDVAMSVISYGELIYGAQKSQHTEKSMKNLNQLIQLIPPLPLPLECGEQYGRIRKTLEKRGKTIGNNDLWIAAHALALNTTLVSNNLKEFERVPNLNLENWV